MPCATREECALRKITTDPLKWFRDSPMDTRDLALILSTRPPWISFGQSSYVRKIYHKERGQPFDETSWTIDENEKCKQIVQSTGATLVGYPPGAARPADFTSMLVNVNITGTVESGFNWGFLSTQPGNIRLFQGPQGTCEEHPWDAMILRDCTTNSDNFAEIPEVSSRKYDILAVKMCEDFDYPWIVLAVNDSGPAGEALVHMTSIA